MAELAKLLPVPVDVLIARAVFGEVHLFVKIPDRADVFSVHAEAVDLGDPLVDLSRFLQGASLPDRAAAAPVEMKSDGVQALQLSPADCLHVLQNRPVRQCLFECGFKSEGAYWSLVRPRVRNFFSAKKVLSDAGWRVACYPAGAEIAFSDTAGYARPIGLDLARDAIFTTRESVGMFLDGIDANKYVGDLLVDGDVIVDRPSYFSEKLNYVIDTSEKFWRKFIRDLLTTSERSKSKTSVKPQVARIVTQGSEAVDQQEDKAYRHLQAAAFSEFCGKGKASRGLIKAASDFIVPVAVRSSVGARERAMYKTYITPEVLALMAAARYFWGRKDVMLDEVSTHPLRKDIERFFRHMGFKDNDAKFAVTLISLENAARGRPVPATRRRLMASIRKR